MGILYNLVVPAFNIVAAIIGSDAFFEPDMSNEDIQELIVKVLAEWKKKGGIG